MVVAHHSQTSSEQLRDCLILKGGHLIDPKNTIDTCMDIAIRGGKIVAVAPNLDISAAIKIIDISGLYVIPGIIDIHTHLFATTGLQDAWAGDLSVLPDGFSFRSGITTMVDAGSSGWRNFETFRHTVIDRVQTRVLAFINIASFGMISDLIEQDKRDFTPEIVAKMVKKHQDVIVGIKSAHYQLPDWASVEKSVEAGEKTGIPVMVDFGYFLKERPYWRLVTEKLRPGDISTHCFRGPIPFVDEQGKLFEYLYQARNRGVIFDVGHGQGSFIFRNVVPATQQGFYPDSISTDLHVDSMNVAMMDILSVMSKFLALGMPLYEVILRSTWNPAQIIQRPELGHLSIGAAADISVLHLNKGDYSYGDAGGGKISGHERLFCEMTLKAGQIVWDWNARSFIDYQTLGPRYGIREGVEYLVLPPT